MGEGLGEGEMTLTRTEYRQLAENAQALVAALEPEELAQPGIETRAATLHRAIPGASEKQVLRALRKALRQRLGQKAPQSGSPPNFSLQLDEPHLKFLREKAPAYGSQAAVVRAALDR